MWMSRWTATGAALCLWSMEFYETDLSRGFVRGYAYQFGRGIGPVTEAIFSEATAAALGCRTSQRISKIGGAPHRIVGNLRGSAENITG